MDGQGISMWLPTLGYLVFFILMMYLLIFLPQKRRDKKAKAMLDSMQVGNEVITIGGVSGKIINIKDDEVTIETGVEKAKINFKKWAIKEVIKPIEN
ncbi:MAG TPA: preprotein translocase subunit YajC [Clostridiales bacterium]|jgi:preprotein translocase subunit YajC|nr:preprotein translocase subunit YajC [Clostridiales bacterium]HQD30704.1 preprotein translocase subunit YajC [Clostridiales bacterium]